LGFDIYDKVSRITITQNTANAMNAMRVAVRVR